MCRTIHALLQTVICAIQMLVRVFMTIILMFENLIRMILQTLYNFISFLLQMISLIPICVVFLLTARLKCFMCGGGGPCPVNRGGACDCIMSAVAIAILFLIFRATGILDKIFYSIGYTKAKIPVYRFVPTPGFITECSRNDSDYEYIFTTVTDIGLTFSTTEKLDSSKYSDYPGISLSLPIESTSVSSDDKYVNYYETINLIKTTNKITETTEESSTTTTTTTTPITPTTAATTPITPTTAATTAPTTTAPTTAPTATPTTVTEYYSVVGKGDGTKQSTLIKRRRSKYFTLNPIYAVITRNKKKKKA